MATKETKVAEYINNMIQQKVNGYACLYPLGTYNVAICNKMCSQYFDMENNYDCLQLQLSRELHCACNVIVYIIFWYNAKKKCMEAHILQYKPNKSAEQGFMKIGVVPEKTPLFFKLYSVIN